MTPEADNKRFAKVVEALRPWLSDVVIAGGWAHRLYRLHALANSLGYWPLMTKDVDVVLGSSPPPGEANMRERLLAAQFTEEMSGEDRPPITYYQVGSTEEPFYVEFLTPLVGSENKRDGTRDTTQLVGGVSAQKLRHLELLLLGPWCVTVGSANGFPFEQPTMVRVPNPAAYLAQKLLVIGRRKREDQERDVLYVHDTLQTFGGHLVEVRAAWLGDVVPNVHPHRVSEVEASILTRFSDMTDLVRGAAHIAVSVGRATSSQSLLDACQLGLDRVFR
jgi:hypothetical protein